MKRILFLFLSLSVAAMIGCNSKTESKSGDGADSAVSDAEPTPWNFSTPTAAVETMIAAAVAKDVDTLAECFAADAAGEFDSLKKKTASDGMLLELAEFMSGGTVTGEKISADGTQAVVEAKLGRDEQITVTKTDAGWKVVDF